MRCLLLLFVAMAALLPAQRVVAELTHQQKVFEFLDFIDIWKPAPGGAIQAGIAPYSRPYFRGARLPQGDDIWRVMRPGEFLDQVHQKNWYRLTYLRRTDKAASFLYQYYTGQAKNAAGDITYTRGPLVEQWRVEVTREDYMVLTDYPNFLELHSLGR